MCVGMLLYWFCREASFEMKFIGITCQKLQNLFRLLITKHI